MREGGAKSSLIRNLKKKTRSWLHQRTAPKFVSPPLQSETIWLNPGEFQNALNIITLPIATHGYNCTNTTMLPILPIEKCVLQIS